jgi:regulator of RNase E activity RraA
VNDATKISPAVLNQLRKFDTPTISNVIELFDVVPRTAGYMDARIKACFPKLPVMIGYASTATFRSSAQPRKGDVYSGMAEQVATFASLPGPAVVVFQDLDDPAVAATFGEVMCSTYKGFGAAGLISSGAGRDLDQVEALGFPCFTNGTICSHGYCHILQLNVPVRVGGLTVHPGDLLHGDRNGVTAIPLQIAVAVADACPEFMAAEQVVIDYVKSGKVDAAGFSAAHKECRNRIEALAKRVKG